MAKGNTRIKIGTIQDEVVRERLSTDISAVRRRRLPSVSGSIKLATLTSPVRSTMVSVPTRRAFARAVLILVTKSATVWLVLVLSAVMVIS